jgi:hypothetical protein
MSSNDSGNFWSKAKKPEKSNTDYSLDPNARPPMARWKKVLLYTALASGLIGIVLLAFLPTIASSLAPGLVASQSPKYINGDASLKQASLSWSGPQKLNGLKIQASGKDVVQCDVEVESGLLGLIRGGAKLGLVEISKAKIDLVRDNKGVMNVATLAKDSGPTKQPPADREQPSSLPHDLDLRLDVRNLDFSYADLAVGESSRITLADVDLRADVVVGEPLAFNLKSKSNERSVLVDVKVSNWQSDGQLRLEKAKIDGSFDIANLPTTIIDAFIPLMQDRPDVRIGLGETVSVKGTVKGTRESGAASIDIQSAGLKALVAVDVKDEFITTSAPISVDVTSASLRALVPAISRALEATPDVSLSSFPDVNLRLSDVKVPFSKGEIKTLRGAAGSVELGLSAFSGQLAVDGVNKQFRLTPTKLLVRSPDLSKSLDGSLNTDLVIDGAAGGTVRASFSSGGVLDSKGMLNAALPANLRAGVSIQNIATALLQPFVASTGLELQQDIGPTIDLTAEATTSASTGDDLTPTSVVLKLTSREILASTQFSTSNQGIEFAPDATKLELKSAGRLLSRLIAPETGWSVNPRTGTVVVSISGAALPESSDGSFAYERMQLRSTITADNIALSRIGDATSAVQLRNAQVNLGVAAGRVTSDIKSSLVINSKPAELNLTLDTPGVFIAPTTESGSFIAATKSLRPTGRVTLKGLPVDGIALFLSQDDAESKSLITLAKGIVGESSDLMIASQPDQQSGGFGIGVNIRAPKLAVDVSGRLSPREISLAAAKLGLTIDGATVSSLLHQFAPNVSGLPTLSNASKIDLTIGSFALPLDAEAQPVWSQAGTLSLALQSDGRTLIDGLRVQDDAGKERDLGRVGFQGLKLNASVPFQTLFGAGQPDARMFNADLVASLIGPAQSTLADLKLKSSVEIKSGKPVGPLALDLSVERIDVRQLESLAQQSNLASTLLGGQLGIRSNIVVTPDAGHDPLQFTTSTIELSTTLEAKGLTTNGPIVASISPELIALRNPASLSLKIDPAFVNNMMRESANGNPPLSLTRASAVSVIIDALSLPRIGGKDLNIKAQIAAPEIRLVDTAGRELSLVDTKFNVATDNAAPTKPLNFTLEMKSVAVDAQSTTKPLSLRGSIDNMIGANGAPDISKGVLTFNADIKGIPTVLIDTLSDQKGLLVDLLGDSTDVLASANKVPLKNASTLNGQQFGFKLSSPRISTSINGSVTDSIFASSVPLNVSVSEITNALTQRYIGAVPVLKKLEKQSVQQAATISEQALRVPLDSNMMKLNGTVIFDPGEVTYEVNPMLSKLLKENVLRSNGIMGNKLQPAKIVFTNGVGVLDRYTLPLGEFSVGFEGKVDLVGKKSEMVVWVPAAQLADAVTGQVTKLLSAGSTATSDSNTILSTLLEVVPNWPFKAAGPLTSPASSLTLDADRVFEEFKKNGGYKKLIERVGGSKIKDLLKPKLPGTPTAPK